MYRLFMSKKLEKFLAKHNEINDRILTKLKILKQNPKDESLDIKPLKAKEGHFRLRVGKYRILYELLEQEILIYAYDADSKGDIYKD